jgi:NCS1 family nucleobase:cation symporter-1
VRGGLMTAVLGIMIMPWKLLSDYSSYIFGWLVGYSGFLGPIAGILICDYFLVKKKELNVIDLYRRNGEYEFTKGYNLKAIYALLAGVFVALIGLLVPSLRFLYDYAWFVGFAISFIIYLLIMKKK